MTRIIGITGRAGSGKSTLAKAVVAHYAAAGFHAERMAFAGPLKRLCVDVLGLTDEQVSGGAKDTPTTYRWEDLPHYIEIEDERNLAAHRVVDPQWRKMRHTVDGNFDVYVDMIRDEERRIGKFGPMTARQVMQQVGTDIFRRLDPDVWVKAAMREVDNLDISIDMLRDVDDARLCGELLVVFDDLRFANEAAAVTARGGFVVRLLGGGDATHASEDVDAVPAQLTLDSFALGVDKTLEKLIEYAEGHYAAAAAQPAVRRDVELGAAVPLAA